ncbi:MAG: L-serine ammonia-lyase [Acidobacteria bacterium]|nr:L-serine ammonia-lyase [Acidobacteriota bacterium]
MAVSVFDLFTIGIGPSSSHTVGPMRAARQFALALQASGDLARAGGVRVHLYGSLAATGRGHGSHRALMLGLEGEIPEQVDVDRLPERIASIASARRLNLLGRHAIPFDPGADLVFERRGQLPGHPNGMRFIARGKGDAVLDERIYYSVGGGFVAGADAAGRPVPVQRDTPFPLPFSTAEELLALCAVHGAAISSVMLRNECAWRAEADVRSGLLAIWEAMQQCVRRGCETDGELPGLQVPRRAAKLYRQLAGRSGQSLRDPLTIMDWVNLYALAVNEENAVGGRVVTAPTNGAAGIVPAVLHYYARFCPSADEDGVVRFLLTAGAIGLLFKVNASISGAEVGCQGEVGSACSMAAAGLTEALGGTPAQVENAAEIAMEHNLGLTCDPIGGLVQIPCIERNAMAAVKAINASRLALRGSGEHVVSLDKVIRTMRDTGRDMQEKYKETSRGGLAAHVVHVPVNVIEC